MKFGMFHFRPTSTLLDPNVKMCEHEGNDLKDTTMYRQLVDSLIYLILKRANIFYIVGVMSDTFKIQRGLIWMEFVKS